MCIGDEKNITTLLKKEIIYRKRKDRKIEIDGVVYFFEEAELPFHILADFPVNFTLLDKEKAQIKYPYENRPEFIFTNLSGTINFCIDFFELESQGQGIEEICDMFRLILKKSYPANLLSDNSYIEAPVGVIGSFETIRVGLDENIHMFMFMFIAKDNLIFGNFSMPTKIKSAWKNTVLDIIASFKYKEMEEK